MTRISTAISMMLRRLWGGLKSVHAAKHRWYGSTPTPTAATATGNPAAVKVSTYDDYDLLVAEIMYEEIRKLEKRLEFEAWADSR